MSGNKPWTMSPANPYSGSYCSRSGAIGHNQKSVMEMTLNVSQEGIISFARKVNCEVEFDFLRFAMDGVEMERWSGNCPGPKRPYPVTGSSHLYMEL